MSDAPYSIGVIMDGNRRWAREKDVPVVEGHKAGYEKIKELIDWAGEAGVNEIVIYAFSTENWKRSEEEVGHLMALIDMAIRTLGKEVVTKGIRLRFIGERSILSEKLQNQMVELEEETSSGTKGTLAIALSYGGRAEILSAVNELLSTGLEQVTETELRAALWSHDLADPDLIIRTGGDKRLSNFLTWQSVYSELFFTDTKWPDFSKEEFLSILEQFASRERRLGA